MECVPAVRIEVENVAEPAVRVPVPSTDAPSLKVTVPVIVPGDALVTFAVKVTAWPTFEGLREEVNAVVVGCEFTTWVTTGEVLVLREVLPL